MQRNELSEYRLSADHDSLFPFTAGNQVKFYSNAYDRADSHAHGAFADMFRDLNAAQHHICIVGWALSSTEKFGENDDELPTLLVRKAMQGVRVIVLAWDNIVPVYSREHKLLTRALDMEMGRLTPDQQTVVRQHLHVKFSPRELGYTDHQKMVIADAVLYIGGLDLVGGRSNPDEWHDSHARIEGLALLHAIDLIHARWDGLGEDSRQETRASAQIGEIRHVLQEHNHAIAKDIDIDQRKLMRLLCSVRQDSWGSEHRWFNVINKAHTQEIQEAHIIAIKRAEKFIYMENQFFIGNRRHKNKKDTVESTNLVIAALVNKVLEKIARGEEFHLYCQLPYRPEGKPHALDVRLILRKQWKTMEWVIDVIDHAAKLHGKTAADYLTFYNMGRMKNNKYHMKYTHSKLMIIDDKELILGSANCNERSMAGNRDSEAAMHMYGYETEIANYRERLLCEHFGDEFVGANAQLLMLHPEKTESRSLLQNFLNNNLMKLGKADKPVATPWGNISVQQLMNREKPEYVPGRTPLPSGLVMGAVQWARKLPL